MSNSFVTSTGPVTVVTPSSGQTTIINSSPDAGVSAALAKIGSAASPSSPINASVTLSGTIPELIPVDTSSGAVTITLPTIASLSPPGASRRFVFKKVSTDSNVITIQASGTNTIESSTTLGTFAATATFSGNGESHTYFGYQPTGKWLRTQ